MYQWTYYTPTHHALFRYRQRMSENKKEHTQTRIDAANDIHLAKRINFMLLFSMHGRFARHKHLELRYYFDWTIVIDNRARTVVTVYRDEKRGVPHASSFGNTKTRDMIYDIWFRPKSKAAKMMKQMIEVV